jgi:integrase
MNVHEHLRQCEQIRNVRQSIDTQYSVDVFPKYISIQLQPSPSHATNPERLLMLGFTSTTPSTPTQKGPIHVSNTTSPTSLLEPSFTDAIRLIAEAPDLADHQRQHWPCSLRRIADGLDRPPELIPARWTSIRMQVAKLHHARVAMSPKTLANHKANVRAALRWLGGEKGLPSRGAPLDERWAKLRDLIRDKGLRARLYGLMRYCSAKGIAPEALTEEVLEAFLRYRAETTALGADVADCRSIARSWNRCVDEIPAWPKVRLLEPALLRDPNALLWEEVPQSLRQEIDAYLTTLLKKRRGASGKRWSGAKPSTIRTREAEIRAFVRQAVRIGVPVDELTSLSRLLDPNLVERVLQSYADQNGGEPKTYTIALGWKLLSIARQTTCLGEQALEQLDDLRAGLEEHRQGGMTEKNMAVIRQVMTASVWSEVVRLPAILMQEARDLRQLAPVKAAVRAQLAVAIGILTVAPVRLGNLARIRLEENLIRPAGPLSPYWLVFPNYDVKNRVKLEFDLKERLTGLIEEYLHDHRPALMRGANEPWLFPGENGRHKTLSTLREQITAAVEDRVGIRVTPHQYRHAAAALIIRATQDYELARRVLGHRNLRTTTNFYTALESLHATERFGDIVRAHLAPQTLEGVSAW